MQLRHSSRTTWISLALIVQLVAVGRAQERRVALVLGNAAYQTAAPLPSCLRDAAAVGQTLRACGFDTRVATDRTRAEIVQDLAEFASAVRGAKAALFYFSGHGVQIDGRNYLVAVGPPPRESLGEILLAAEDVFAVMNDPRRVNIVVFDACRNNGKALSSWSGPGQRGARGAAPEPAFGFSSMRSPAGGFLAFATAPGTTAAAGPPAEMSLYTKHWLRHLPTRGLTIESIFKRTRESVLEESRGMQQPWEHSSLVGDFFFLPPAATAGPAVGASPPVGLVIPAPVAEPPPALVHVAEDFQLLIAGVLRKAGLPAGTASTVAFLGTRSAPGSPALETLVADLDGALLAAATANPALRVSAPGVRSEAPELALLEALRSGPEAVRALSSTPTGRAEGSAYGLRALYTLPPPPADQGLLQVELVRNRDGVTFSETRPFLVRRQPRDRSGAPSPRPDNARE